MGARRIAGITVEIGGDTTKLTTALKDVDKALSTTQSSLRDVNKLLKLDPGNTELLAQKHRLLGEAVSETKEKLATLKTAAEQANQALANGEITQSQYDALQREIIETEQKLKDLERQAENSSVALQKIGQVGDKLQDVGNKVSGVGEDLTKSVTVPLAGIGTAANFESSMSQVQATMGISKDAMSEVNGETVNTMDTLSALAKQMGSETAFSASECAEALNYLALAGYSTQEMWAIRRMNDKLCLEHGLSIVENPKPSREHYGTWMGSQKQPSHQEQLRRAIDAALEEKPKDFEELLKKLEAAGIEVNRERKHLRFRLSPEDRYTRCDTLKGDYTEQAIKERIAGTRTAKSRRTSPQKPVSKVGLLVDIEAAIRSGKGPGYERWAKVFNLKQLSQAVIWLKEHGDMSYEDLQEKSDAATASFNALSVQIKELESQMTANGELQKQIVNYSKTRSVYIAYRKAGYSKKFRAAHETEILLHQAAKKHFDGLGITKLPSVKSLREEYAGLLEQKRKAYSSYKQARADMKELHNVRANVEHLLDIPTGRESQRDTQKLRQ